jgi:zinc protease
MRLIARTTLMDRVPASVHELDNGLRLVIAQIRRRPIVECQVWYGVGSADEKPGKTGLAHFLEHLMFKGTRRHPTGVFDRTLERLGGDTNAATWLDWTYYKVKLLVAHLPTLLELEADRMVDLDIPEPGFLAEKDVVKNERLLRVDNDPNGFVEERFFEDFFGPHPYAQPTIGTMPDIDGLTLDDVLGFYRTWYNPSNAVLALTGDLDEASTLETVERLFGGLPAGARRDRKPLLGLSAQRARERLDLELPVAQARLLVGYPSPAKWTRESVHGMMVNELLVGARSSALYRRVVTEEELAVSAAGWMGALQMPSLYQLEWLLTQPQFSGRVLEVLDEEIDRLARGEVDPEEVEGARARLRMGVYGNLQSVEGMASALGEMTLLRGGVEWFDTAVHELEKAALSDLSAFAHKHLRGPGRLVCLASPRGEEVPA